MWPKIEETGVWLRLSVGSIGDDKIVEKLDKLTS